MAGSFRPSRDLEQGPLPALLLRRFQNLAARLRAAAWSEIAASHLHQHECDDRSSSHSVLPFPPQRSGQHVLGLMLIVKYSRRFCCIQEAQIAVGFSLALLISAVLPPLPPLPPPRPAGSSEMHFPSCCWISPPSVALRPCNSVTSFPSRANTAFLTEIVACGKGVGREEGVGCVLGELLLLQFRASICILSLLCMASCFFTPLLFETTSCKQQGGQGVEVSRLEEASGDTCKRFGWRLWKRHYMLMYFSGCDPVVAYRRSGSLRRCCCGTRVLLRNALLGATRLQRNCPLIFHCQLSFPSCSWMDKTRICPVLGHPVIISQM